MKPNTHCNSPHQEDAPKVASFHQGHAAAVYCLASYCAEKVYICDFSCGQSCWPSACCLFGSSSVLSGSHGQMTMTIYVLRPSVQCRKQLAANLWRRADQEGARTQMERRNFGIADDVYAAGLLLAYMAFMPFCQPGSIDAPSLQRQAHLPALLYSYKSPA